MQKVSAEQYLSDKKLHGMTSNYLIIGIDNYFIDKVLATIKDTIRKRFHSEISINTVYGDEIEPTQLRYYLDEYSIFYKKRMLVIRKGENLIKDDLNIIEEYLHYPDEDLSLVIITEKIDARLSSWKTIKDHFLTIECDPPKYTGDLIKWLNQLLQENKKDMEANAKQAFVERVELDYSTAFHELEKLFIYCHEKKIITKDDVLQSLSTIRAKPLSEFYRVLGSKKLPLILSEIEDMLDNEWEPLQISSNIYKFFNIIWRIHALRKNHLTPREIEQNHLPDIYPTYRKDYLKYAENYPYECIPDIFAKLLQLDTQFKLSEAEPNILFAICLAEICCE